MFDVPILFEDDFFLILNKPAGLSTQPTLDRKRQNLYEMAKESGLWKYIGMHHRLDVPTSGVILFTKREEVNKSVTEMFRNHTITKTYHCLVFGKPTNSEWVVENFLREIKLPSGKSKMRSVKSGGDKAITKFSLIEEIKGGALIRAQPQTGRRHQIRVHLAEGGTPILGDALYFRIDRKYPRLMLHAESLSFIHPCTRKEMKIQAPWPDDFQLAYTNNKFI